MQASRTCFRCFCTYINVSTVTALPYHFYIFLEYFIIFYILHESQVSFFMSFSATAISRYILAIAGKPSSSAMSAISDNPSSILHFHLLQLLSGFQCSTDYAGRIAGSNFYHSTFQPLEHSLGMFLFLISSFHKIAEICSKPSFFATLAK